MEAGDAVSIDTHGKKERVGMHATLVYLEQNSVCHELDDCLGAGGCIIPHLCASPPSQQHKRHHYPQL